MIKELHSIKAFIIPLLAFVQLKTNHKGYINTLQNFKIVGITNGELTVSYNSRYRCFLIFNIAVL